MKKSELRGIIKEELKTIKKSNLLEAKLISVDSKLINDRITKSGLLALLGDNNQAGNKEKMAFQRELATQLKKLYKKHSSLKIK